MVKTTKKTVTFLLMNDMFHFLIYFSVGVREFVSSFLKILIRISIRVLCIYYNGS